MDTIYLYLDNHRGLSCLANLSFFEKMMKMIDEGCAVDVVYMHFSKAFDKVHIVG